MNTIFIVVKYSLCGSFTTTMDIIGDHVELLVYLLIGFETSVPLRRAYIRELSREPKSFDLENKPKFVVAGSYANNVQSVKEIHAMTNL